MQLPDLAGVAGLRLSALGSTAQTLASFLPGKGGLPGGDRDAAGAASLTAQLLCAAAPAWGPKVTGGEAGSEVSAQGSSGKCVWRRKEFLVQRISTGRPDRRCTEYSRQRGLRTRPEADFPGQIPGSLTCVSALSPAEAVRAVACPRVPQAPPAAPAQGSGPEPRTLQENGTLPASELPGRGETPRGRRRPGLRWPQPPAGWAGESLQVGSARGNLARVSGGLLCGAALPSTCLTALGFTAPGKERS